MLTYELAFLIWFATKADERFCLSRNAHIRSLKNSRCAPKNARKDTSWRCSVFIFNCIFSDQISSSWVINNFFRSISDYNLSFFTTEWWLNNFAHRISCCQPSQPGLELTYFSTRFWTSSVSFRRDISYLFLSCNILNPQYVTSFVRVKTLCFSETRNALFIGYTLRVNELLTNDHLTLGNIENQITL